MSTDNAHINLTQAQNQFVSKVIYALEVNEKNTRPQLKKIANSLGIQDKTKIKELSELAIVMATRELAHRNEPIKEKYDNIVSLYKRQVNLSFRTSQSILLQQYSTPAPIGYLMGLYCGIDKKNTTLFEPSAGNGLLTITAKPNQVIVNEIDEIRRINLYQQGYKEVLSQDATKPFRGFTKKFDAVITNPPFGRLDKPIIYDSYPIKELDHHMALVALSTMKQNGKSAIIIGGHTKWDTRGRIQKGKNRIFFNYLYSHYYVEDVIPINGGALYQ